MTFRFEPFIVACECGTLDIAKRLVKIGRESGFRESGIVLGKERINVTIRSTARLEIPICADGLLLVSDAYLSHISQIASRKFETNRKRIEHFATLFAQEFTQPKIVELPLESNWEPIGDNAMLEFRRHYFLKLGWNLIDANSVGVSCEFQMRCQVELVCRG